MFIIVDLVIIILIALCTFLGYRKGLIKTAIKIFSFFLSIIIALILYKPVSEMIINKTTLDDNIKNIIVNNIVIEENEDGKVELNDENSNLPEIAQEYINESIKEVAKDATNSMANVVAEKISVIVVQIATLVVLFILAKILLLLLNLLADVIGSIPIIKQFNKLGGFIYGVLKGIVLVYLIFAILSFISPLIANSVVLEYINNSNIGKFMYNDNILLKLIFKK